MYYTRTLTDIWPTISKQFPVLLLTGPRQVGKTTFLQRVCEKNRRYVTLDDLGARSLANEDPALFLSRYEPPVLIDEIQYAPALLPYIKMAVDEQHINGQFWLTGSQQFAMMKGISETLAGRVAILNLLGFSQRERRRRQIAPAPFLPSDKILSSRLEQAPKPNLKRLYEQLWLGHYPGLVAEPNKDRHLFYSSYLQTYLERDVRDLAQVGNQAAFTRFVRACAARTGQLLNLSDLARDVDVSVPTAKQWLSILQASFQVYLLPPYHSNVTKRIVKTPKLYFLDTGLCSYLTEWSTPETLESGAMSGALFETYVLTEILKSYWHRGRLPLMYYYRDKDQKEIDILIEQDQTLYPIEVKKSSTIRSEWTRPFSVLNKLAPSRKIGAGVIICMIPSAQPIIKTCMAIPVTAI